MHKFIIVGHPQSGYQEVENLLHECGMGKAKPSRREGLLPDEISETLRQAHGTPALAALTSAEQVEQIGTAPVWHGMAMDLMLGNLDQRFWGWSDPGAIHLLEYWKQLDPTINFVFVYADPQSALVGPGADDALAVEAKLANWQAFNAAMLHFYNRNPKRSVLVQADQVRHSVRAYLQQLRTQLNAPLSDPPPHLLPAVDGEQIESDAESFANLGAPKAGDQEVGTLTVKPNTPALPVDAVGLADGADLEDLPRFVAGHCVAQYPAAGQLYEELQAVASLPLDLAMQTVPAAEAAWVALLMNTRRAEWQRAALREHEAQLVSLQQQAAERRAALERVEQDVVQKQKALEDSHSRIDELNIELLRLQDVLTDRIQLDEKNVRKLELLQETLEQECVARQAHERSLAESTVALDAAQAALLAVREEAQEQRRALEVAYRATEETQQALASSEAKTAELVREIDGLRASLVEHAEIKEENDLLLNQLHRVQEELERLFHLKADQEGALAESAAKLEQAKSQWITARKEADELSIALQAERKAKEIALASSAKAIDAAKSSERALHEKLKATEKAAKDAARSLMAVRRELDEAHVEEAKLKDALVTKTAEQQEAQNENLRILSQLQVVQEELERYHAEIQHLKKTTIPRDPPLYGAAERVKQQLTYRLGATMIHAFRAHRHHAQVPHRAARDGRQEAATHLQVQGCRPGGARQATPLVSRRHRAASQRQVTARLGPPSLCAEARDQGVPAGATEGDDE